MNVLQLQPSTWSKNMFSSKKKHSPSSAPANGLASQSQATQHQQPHKSQSNPQSPQQNHQSWPICPWSAHTPSFGQSPSPFPRSSHALSTAPTTPEELFFFGGFVHSSGHASNDLYVMSTQDFSTTLLQANGDVPSPRYAHGAVFTSTTLVVWGGMLRKHQCNDNSLYLLNLASREWTRVVVNGPGPCARYYHTMTLVGSKLFVFGGQSDAWSRFNDMWTFDLNSLNPVWESYEPTPGNEKPLPRTGHVSVTIGDRIIIFGGVAKRYYNDTWSFDISTRKWTEVQCTGPIPSPRSSHAAVLVDNVMYVFGGRAPDGTKLGDLTALNLLTQQWFAFQDIGSDPCGRRCHAMASDGRRVFLLGGELSPGAQVDDAKLIHVLDTKLLIDLKPDSNTVNHSERTTQLAQELFSGLPTQGQPLRIFSSSDTGAAHGAFSSQMAISEDTGVDDKPRRVPQEDDDSESSAEHLAKPVSPDTSEKEFVSLEHERLVQLERQLLAMCAAQTERDRRIAQLTDQLVQNSALLEQAEANAAEENNRAGLEQRELQAKLDEFLLSRDKALEQGQSALQEATSCAAEANRRSQRELAEVHAKLEARESELAAVCLRLMEAQRDLQNATSRAVEADERSQRELARVHARLEARESELAAVRLRLMDAEDGWAKSKAEWSQRDLQNATSHAAEANERSKLACEQIGEYERKLAGVRAELEEKKSELEAVRLQLTDANGDDGGAKSSSKAEKLCVQNSAGPLDTEEDRVTRGIMERMRAMEAQIASLRWSEKSFELMECRNEG